MPRDASGNYTLPAGNPVVSGTIITSDWANLTMPDLGNETTNSLSRNGQGGMLAPLKHVNGTELLPSLTFLNDVQSGLYLNAVAELIMSVAGANLMRWTAGVVEIWNGASWVPVATADQITNYFTGANPDLIDIDAALLSGNNNAATEDHIEYGFDLIQAKGDTTSPNVIKINALGGTVQAGSQDVGQAGAVELFYNGERRFYSSADGGVTVEASGVSGTNRLINFVNSGGGSTSTQVGETGGVSVLANIVQGGLIALRARTSLNSTRDVVLADPDFYGNDLDCASVNRIRIKSTDAAGSASPPFFLGAGAGNNLHISGDEIAAYDSGVPGELRVNNTVGSTTILGSTVTRIEIDPSNINLYHDSELVARTEPIADGGLEVQKTAGWGSVLTEVDIETGSFLGTFVGVAGAPTRTFTYQKLRNVVTLTMEGDPGLDSDGTPNLSVTGLPAVITPQTQPVVVPCMAYDGADSVDDYCAAQCIITTTNVLSFSKALIAAGFLKYSNSGFPTVGRKGLSEDDTSYWSITYTVN